MHFSEGSAGLLSEQISAGDFLAVHCASDRNLEFRRSAPSGRTVLLANGLAVVFDFGSPLALDMSFGRRASLVAKRAIDVFVGGLALIAFLPLMIVIAAVIRCTSPGPALFRQSRLGLNGRIISVLKFRSMYADCADEAGIYQAERGDTRITPIGRFIRQTSLDELPQLLNVLHGSMSLVGPRPHPVFMRAGGVNYEELVPYYHSRLQMKPGITGWAQANGLRGPTAEADAAKARLEHDLAYIQNFSLWLDIRILARTLHREFISGSAI